MIDIVLETARAVILGVLLVCLWRIGRRRTDLRQRGWWIILGGFVLLLFGSLIDISDEFEPLSRFGVVGSTPIQAILEKIVGYSGGFLLVTLGLLRWLPAMASLERINDLVDELQQANVQLNASNSKLREQMEIRQIAEQEMGQDRRLLRAILESNRDGILVVRDAQQVLHANQRFCELWDVPDDLVKLGDDQKLLDFVVGQVENPAPFLAEVLRLYASSEESCDVVCHQDGRVFERHSWPLNSHGFTDGRIWTFSDITARHRTEADLRKLSRAVEQSTNTIVVTDLNGQIEYVNRAFEQSTGFTREEAIGRAPSLVKSGNQSREFYQQLWATITSGRQWQGELQNRHKNGALYWESATISPVTDEAGAICNYLSVQDDITDRRRAEQDLQEHAVALGEADNVLLPN